MKSDGLTVNKSVETGIPKNLGPSFNIIPSFTSSSKTIPAYLVTQAQIRQTHAPSRVLFHTKIAKKAVRAPRESFIMSRRSSESSIHFSFYR